METADILVIGGGASGLLAAGTAASKGKKVVILERMPRPARKLRITGKGRCNITNIAPIKEFLQHTGPDNRFLNPVFSRFFSGELIAFLNSIGIKTITERGGRVFPEGGDAKIVTDKLVSWAERQGVKIQCGIRVMSIIRKENTVTGVMTDNGTVIHAPAVILASGGCSYPLTGSTGDGYTIASELGHSVKTPLPVLVPLNITAKSLEALAGLELKNVRVNVFVEEIKCGDAFGDMTFTGNSISGPIILSLSRRYMQDITDGKKVVFMLDLKPALNNSKLDLRLIREINADGKRTYRAMLNSLLPMKLIPEFVKMAKIPQIKPAAHLSPDDRNKIRLLLKGMPLEICGHRGFEEAIVTAGGVSTAEIDPTTMESKLIKNLYFAGEVIDLDADTGGYNLQIAFSTGWLAGMSAATK
ncbi:MAG: NAD(P)/FAD-dependent oxidoreductase [Bacteroidota bacterium]